MAKKPKPAPPPAPITIRQYLAEQTGTQADDWVPVPTGTTKYRKGYRWWNKVTNQYAKRVAV